MSTKERQRGKVWNILECSNSLEMPKSVSFTSPFELARMFCGLMSRCTRFSCRK